MIYVLCSGGLGNQMFQYAFFRHLENMEKSVVLDTSFFQHNRVHSGFTLEKAFGIKGENDKDHFSLFWKMAYSIMSRKKISNFAGIIMEDKYRPFDFEGMGDKAVLYGFWQSESFFFDVRDKIRRDFTFQNLSQRSLDLARKMEGENSVAIHIRRGDYLANSQYVDLSATDYYINAIKMVRERLGHINIYVFSDDLDWCKKSSLFDESTVYVDFNDGAHAYEDMYLMSKARVIITANSTFSWWAGYLGEHLFVIRPERYLIKWSKEDDDRLFPKDWMTGYFGG